MRKIFIDLSSDNHLQQPKIFGGYEGEHNETLLQVKLPKRMIGIECSGYRFDFQTSEDNKISSPLIPTSELEDDILSFCLIEQLTIAGKLTFAVVAVLADATTVDLVSKTQTVFLYIDDSPRGHVQTIDPNGYKDELLAMVDMRILQVQPTTGDTYNHEKYFDITEDGMAFLKPEYRGAFAHQRAGLGVDVSPWDAKTSEYPYAISDNGKYNVGSKNHILPNELYIPETVNGVAVTSLAPAMFAYNYRVKKVILNDNITTLPDLFLCRAINLEEVDNTAKIAVLGTNVFDTTMIKKVEFPDLTEMGKESFNCCPELEDINLGTIETIPDCAFFGCAKLVHITIADPVTTIGYGSFWGCYNLRTLKNIIAKGSTREIGKEAFIGCRATYTWSELTGCTFKTAATSAQMHNSEFWKTATFTPCSNKALSFFNQYAAEYRLELIGTAIRFNNACSLLTPLSVYCSMHNIEVTDIHDLIDILDAVVPNAATLKNQLNVAATHSDALGAVYAGLGLERTGIEAPITTAALQQIYDALAQGNYVALSSPLDLCDKNPTYPYIGHTITITGITPTGELIVQNTINRGWATGTTESSVGRVPIQNLINTKDGMYPSGSAFAYIISKSKTSV